MKQKPYCDLCGDNTHRQEEHNNKKGKKYGYEILISGMHVSWMWVDTEEDAWREIEVKRRYL